MSPDSCPAPAKVRRAFGVDAEQPIALKAPVVWRFGDVVLKSVRGVDVDEAEWISTTVARTRFQACVVPAPLAADDGCYVIDDWTASAYVPTIDRAPTPDDVFAAADAFHSALRTTTRPGFFDTRGSKFATADRLAWRETTWSPTGHSLDGVVESLFDLCESVHPVEQCVHGDLAGNVAVAADGGLVIFDVSPYWRSTEYAEAIAAIDMVQWHGASELVLERVAKQYLVRGALFRALAVTLFRNAASSEVAVWERTVELVAALS